MIDFSSEESPLETKSLRWLILMPALQELPVAKADGMTTTIPSLSVKRDTQPAAPRSLLQRLASQSAGVMKVCNTNLRLNAALKGE